MAGYMHTLILKCPENSSPQALGWPYEKMKGFKLGFLWHFSSIFVASDTQTSYREPYFNSRFPFPLRRRYSGETKAYGSLMSEVMSVFLWNFVCKFNFMMRVPCRVWFKNIQRGVHNLPPSFVNLRWNGWLFMWERMNCRTFFRRMVRRSKSVEC